MALLLFNVFYFWLQDRFLGFQGFLNVPTLKIISILWNEYIYIYLLMTEHVFLLNHSIFPFSKSKIRSKSRSNHQSSPQVNSQHDLYLKRSIISDDLHETNIKEARLMMKRVLSLLSTLLFISESSVAPKALILNNVAVLTAPKQQFSPRRHRKITPQKMGVLSKI